MTKPVNKKNRTTEPRNPKSKADATEINVPPMMTKPVKVIITVVTVNITKVMNGNANDRKQIERMNARNGCAAKCCKILSRISYAPISSNVRSIDLVEWRPINRNRSEILF